MLIVTDPMARFMLKDGIKDAYTVVADYASGVDAARRNQRDQEEDKDDL